MTPLPFVVREARPSDVPFIENAWRSTMLANCPAVFGADPPHFAREMKRLVSMLLAQATTRVACAPQDEETLVGFACATGDELHYVYVSGMFRGVGLVPYMLEGLPIRRYTFSTRHCERRLRPRERKWLYCPRFTLGLEVS
jgi:hypothetical protein